MQIVTCRMLNPGVPAAPIPAVAMRFATRRPGLSWLHCLAQALPSARVEVAVLAGKGLVRLCGQPGVRLLRWWMIRMFGAQYSPMSLSRSI